MTDYGNPLASLYPHAPEPAQVTSPADMISKWVGIKNALYQGQIAQQHVQQQQLETQMQNARVKSLQKLHDPKYLNPHDSTLDTNAWIADLGKDPETAAYVLEAINIRSQLNAATQSGVNGQGQPTFQAAQSVAAGFNPSSHGQQSTAPTSSPEAQPGTSDMGGGGQAQPDGAPSRVMSAPPGTEGVAASGVTSADNAYKAIAGSGDRIAALRQAKEALGNVSATGPKSEAANALKSYLLSWAPQLSSKVLAIDPDSVNAYDEMNKLFVQYASTQPGASGSDLRTINAVAGNPNIHMQPGAIKTIINSLIGGEIKNQAMMKEWGEAQAKGAAPASFNQFQIPWQNLDRRAFNMEDRDPEDAHNLVQDVRKSGQTTNFSKALQIARKHGYSPPPKKSNSENE